MKKYCKFLIFLLALPLCSLLHAQSVDADVKKVASDQLKNSLKKIPIGQETSFGFLNREEFNLAVVGTPMRVVTINNEFFNDNNANNILELNEWRVPVVVNGQNRLLLTIYNNGTSLNVVDLGGAELSKELEAKMEGAEGMQVYIFRVYPLYMDFALKVPMNSSFEDGIYISLHSGPGKSDDLRNGTVKELNQSEVFKMIRNLYLQSKK